MNDDTVVVMCFSVGVHDFVSKENRESRDTHCRACARRQALVCVTNIVS